MIEALQSLREWAYKLRKSVYKRKRRPQPIHQGTPAGVDYELLDEISRKYFDRPAASISYQHLSAWKTSGAYRIFLTCKAGKVISLIYKESIYSQDEIPALINFPVQPGPAEFVVLSNPRAPLADFLPEVYLAEEIAPNRHYRYILEDLGQAYHQAHSPTDVLYAARMLPRFQEALCIWADSNRPTGLIQYGRPFSMALIPYARAHLERFARRNNNELLRQALGNWDAICEVYLQDEFFSTPLSAVHGDSNYTNVHVHNQEPNRMKLVDWEWAGYGAHCADLVSLLKGTSGELERNGYLAYLESQEKQSTPGGYAHQDSSDQHWRKILWCQMERGLIDAGFFAAQYLGSTHTPSFSLPKAVFKSIRRVLHAYQQLAG